MGVDYYNCDVCNEIYCDAGDYMFCDKCETSFCEGCIDKYNLEYDDDTGEVTINCPICNKKEVKEKELIKYILKKLDMTKEQVRDEMLKMK